VKERETTMLDHLVGLVKVRVLRGVNLAIRDLRSSDPYVVVRIGKQVRSSSSPLLPSFSFLQVIEVCLDLLVGFVRQEICRTSFESIPARSTAETTTNTLLQLFGFYFPCLEFVPL